MRTRIFAWLILLVVPSLAWGQVVIPGTGGATPAVVAGNRTTVVPAACSGTDKMSGIAVGGIVTCATDVTGAASPLTTKGDLYTFTTLDARLPVGADTQCLVADSAAAFGIKWGSCAAAGAGDITDVGPGCATGACWTDGLATTGTLLLVWEGSGVDTNEFTISVPANPGADILWTVPDTAASLTFPTGTTTIAAFSDNLSVFAATTSGQLATLLSNETGSGLAVFGTSPTIVTPTIAATGWTNANHAHAAANSGGQVAHSDLSGIVATDHHADSILESELTTISQLNTQITDATIEVQANKNAVSGYAGLDGSSKLTVSQGQELWALADLTDVASTTGGGTIAVLNSTPTIITPSFTTGFTIGGAAATDDCVLGNATNFVASAACALSTDNLSFFAATTSAQLRGVLSDETGSGAAVFGTTPTFMIALTTPAVVSDAANPADNGVLRVGNTQDFVCSELATPGADSCIQLDASDIWQADGTWNAATLTEGGTGVPNTGDNLSVFAATTSAQFLGVISNETGTTGLVVASINPTLTDVTVNDVVFFTETAGDQACAVGDFHIKANSTSNLLRGCENGSLFTLSAGGADGVGYDEVLDEASGLTKRAQVNFIGGGVSCVDNPGATRTDCTIAGGGTSHEILSGTHTDTTTATVVRGDLMTGQLATPKWQRLALGGANLYPKSDGTDIVYSTLAAAGVGACTNQFAQVLNADAAPTCDSVVLTTDVSGLLPAANGGTGIDSSSSTGIARADSGTWTVAELSGDVTTSGSNATLIAAGVVASAELATANKTFKCNFVLFRDTGLKDTDDINSISNCSRPGRAITITIVRCEVDAGTPVVNLQRDDGSPANVLSSNLTCSTGGADGSIAAAEDNFASTDGMDFVMVSGASGADRLSLMIEYTVD